MALAPGCHPQAPACGKALRARPTIEVGHHWFRIQQWHVETWRLHQMSEDSPWKMGLSENSCNPSFDGLSSYFLLKWPYMGCTLFSDTPKWWKMVKMIRTWNNLDYPWNQLWFWLASKALPFDICQASRRDATGRSFVATSCAASLLRLSHIAKAWQPDSDGLAMFFGHWSLLCLCWCWSLVVGRWLLVVVCCCCFLKDEGLESLRFAHDMLSSLRHIGIFQ